LRDDTNFAAHIFESRFERGLSVCFALEDEGKGVKGFSSFPNAQYTEVLQVTKVPLQCHRVGLTNPE
jgi:hypothetical protein